MGRGKVHQRIGGDNGITVECPAAHGGGAMSYVYVGEGDVTAPLHKRAEELASDSVGETSADGAALGDRLLVSRVQQGDVPAFNALVQRYSRRAFIVARRILGDADDAEDLVQDAFIRALERISTFDTDREFAPWFFRLLTNLGLNARKSRALRRMEAEPPEVVSNDDGPDRLAERSEMRERFDVALAGLPARQRLIVSLYEVDGLPTGEIARMLEVTQETVRWHLHQARQTLRAALRALRE
jgi:RNA polymerase sigma-70 factor (ECF subfamily)